MGEMYLSGSHPVIIANMYKTFVNNVNKTIELVVI